VGGMIAVETSYTDRSFWKLILLYLLEAGCNGSGN